MNEQDTDFGDQVGGAHDINDMAPELPEAELYAAQSAAAEHDFQLFEQSRIFTEHGYSLFPGKKYSRVPYAAESVVQMPENLPSKTQRTSLRHKPNLSDTDSGDQSNTDASLTNGRRKRFKAGLNVFPNDLMSRPEEFNRIFPTFAPFEETVIENREDGFNSSSSADSPGSPPPAIRNEFPTVENGRASSEENDFLTAVEPEQMHNDEALLFFEEQKSDEVGIDTASLGNFKTMLGSDRKAVPSYLKKGGSSKDLAEIGYNPEAVTINVRRSKSNTSAERNIKPNASSAQGKTKVKTLFKSGPVKDSPVKHDKGKMNANLKKSKGTKKAASPVKPSPKSASQNKKFFPKSRSIFKVSNKKLTAKQNRAVVAVRKRLQMSKKKRDDVWCICRKPHGGRFMICCDRCNEWFHGSCVKVTAAQGKLLSKSGAEYVCPRCKTHKPSTPIPVKESKKKVNAMKKGPTSSPLIEPKKIASPAKSRSAFSKMGLFDIGLPARKMLVSKKPDNAEDFGKTTDQKQKTMSAISSVRSKLLLKKASKQVRLPPEKPASSSLKASSPSIKADVEVKPSRSTPLRRSNRHQKDEISPLKLNQVKDSPTDSSSAIESGASEKASPVSFKIDTNLKRKKGRSVSDSDDILSSPAKTDSETESLTTSVKRILRHGRAQAVSSESTNGNIVVTHNDQNVIEVSKKSLSPKLQSSETEEKLNKPLPPAGVSKAKKRALLKATLIKNKSIWNSQYQQMKMALERSADAKKEPEKEENNESGDDAQNGKKKPPDDEGGDGNGNGGSPSTGGSPGKGGNGKGGSSSGGKRSIGRSKSPKSKRGNDGKGSSSSETPERRQSPRKRPDVSIIIESFQVMCSNANSVVSSTRPVSLAASCQILEDRVVTDTSRIRILDTKTSSKTPGEAKCSGKILKESTKTLFCPFHIESQDFRTRSSQIVATESPIWNSCNPELNFESCPNYGCINLLLTKQVITKTSQSITLVPNVQLSLSSFVSLLQQFPFVVHLLSVSWAFLQIKTLQLSWIFSHEALQLLYYSSQTSQHSR